MSDENDVTSGRSAGETKATRNARASLEPAANGFDVNSFADAFAAAQERQRNLKEKPAPLGPVVRALVRCGTMSDGVTPKTMKFTGAQTADGQPIEVPHGRPVRLKREAFEWLSRDGSVIRGE